MFVINSSLGSTDCSNCQIFKKGTVLFAKGLQQPNFAALPIRIAKMPNDTAAAKGLKRIQRAIKTGELYVDLTDLE